MGFVLLLLIVDCPWLVEDWVFFTQRPIPAGAELMFDYKLQHYG